MSEPYYITTAIHYPNGKPHIGHAYEMIAADAIARFQRQAGRDARFQTGTDEHGLKIAQTARARDLTPRQLADEMSAYFSRSKFNDIFKEKGLFEQVRSFCGG